jgi:predicted metal-dependent enzyme (double-stranded beta helix superfamily)
MNLLKTRFAIDDLILEMLRVPTEHLRLDQLQDWVSRLELNDDLFHQHIGFCPESYQRKLLCRTPRFDMLILCWQPGQASTIHDHQESLNVTRVYRGQLTSRCFAAVDSFSQCLNSACLEKERTAATRQSSLSSASTASLPCLRLNQETYLKSGDLAVVDRHQIHQLANTSSENLVTLHVYARPLQTITVYCPDSGKAQPTPVHLSN